MIMRPLDIFFGSLYSNLNRLKNGIPLKNYELRRKNAYDF